MNNTTIPGFSTSRSGTPNSSAATGRCGRCAPAWALCGHGKPSVSGAWNIPLREALPQPLGLRLHHSRGTAALVSVVQILCAWAPLVYMVWIYSQCWNWITPETSVWERGLAVTRWGSEEPVSQWTWDPAGMFSADEFWIREMQPGLAPGTWQPHDRQSFFIVTQPLLMVLGVAGISLGLAGTLAAAVAEWHRRNRPLLALLGIAVVSSGFSLRATIQAEARDVADKRSPVPPRASLVSGFFGDHAISHALPGIAESLYGRSIDLPAAVGDAFAPHVKCGDARPASRDEFLLRCREARNFPAAPRRHIEALRLAVPCAGGELPFIVQMAFESFTDPAGGLAAGSFTTIHCEGLLPDASSAGVIHTWEETTTQIYSAASRELVPPETGAWLASLLRCLRTEGCPDLESLLLPTMLLVESARGGHYTPGSRGILAAALRDSRAGWLTFALTPVAEPSVRLLPGARHELTCNLHLFGTRPSGAPSSQDLEWIIELVFINGRWQALRLRM